VASSTCEECCIHLHSVKLEVSPACPLDALRCTGFEFPNHLLHIRSGCLPAKVIYEGEAFTLDYLFHPLYSPSEVYCEKDRRHW